jgi:hypothetical protein
MEEVAIVIPIYKTELTLEENKSLESYLRHLSSYETRIVAPESLVIPNKIKSINKIKIVRFKDIYFKNIDGYNKLLLSYSFYSKFIDFKYILIYQLDAFVFKDELMFWCDKDYDYIGAPWFEDFLDRENGKDLWCVGNGGFSLRKIQTFLQILRVQSKVEILKDIFWHARKFQFSEIRKNYFYRGSIISKRERKILNFNDNEDKFWALYASEYIENFKKPDCITALGFAFENSPEYLYELNDKKLPFGCHKWEKWMLFWKDRLI